MNRKNRGRAFDQNRLLCNNKEDIMEHEQEVAFPQELALLMRSMQQQQQEIQALRQQLEQQRVQQQQQPQNQGNQHIFQLTSDQILTHFRQLKPFNGKDDYKLTEFIKAVEKAADLCVNEGLRDYALQTVLNEKILGDAKRCIQRLGDSLSWETAKAELKLHFRPQKDYVQLINECRNVKVGNLRELFEIVKSVNYKLNELYSFEEIEDRPVIYSPENNDKHLVGIVMEKLDSLVRGNVEKNSTLIEIYNRFADLKLLDDERAINFFHRKLKNFSKSNNRETNRHTSKQYHSHNTSNFNSNNINNNNNYRGSSNYHNTNYRGNHNNNPINGNNSNNHSGRFSTFNANRFRNSESNGVEPMEIGNVQHQNFRIDPEPANYR